MYNFILFRIVVLKYYEFNVREYNILFHLSYNNKQLYLEKTKFSKGLKKIGKIFRKGIRIYYKQRKILPNMFCDATTS